MCVLTPGELTGSLASVCQFQWIISAHCLIKLRKCRWLQFCKHFYNCLDILCHLVKVMELVTVHYLSNGPLTVSCSSKSRLVLREWFCFSGAGLPRLSWKKRPLNERSTSSSIEYGITYLQRQRGSNGAWIFHSIFQLFNSSVSGGKDLRKQNSAADWYRWYAVWIYRRQRNHWCHFYCKTDAEVQS